MILSVNFDYPLRVPSGNKLKLFCRLLKAITGSLWKLICLFCHRCIWDSWFGQIRKYSMKLD